MKRLPAISPKAIALPALLFAAGLVFGAAGMGVLTSAPGLSRPLAAADMGNLADRLEIILQRQTELELRQASLSSLSREADITGSGAAPSLRRQSANEAQALPDMATLEWAAASIERGLDEIDIAQQREIETIATAVRADRKRLARHWAALGLDPYRRALDRKSGLGGPYIPPPLPGDTDSAFGMAYDAARNDLLQAAAFRKFSEHVPLGVPLASAAEIMSGFGLRRDPFTRGLAMHGGVDLREEPGAPVRATAAGRIIEADWSGGYGRMVEIDHGGGLVTRYAHLSRIAVKPGEWVERGQIVGRVGSTGRSTGPHLHYETHIDGQAVNPLRFIRAAAPVSRYR
jgi:murein DD-endopeptidase MepM/ murein hydrolase activator NlpD